MLPGKEVSHDQEGAAMRKESIIIFTLSALITAIIVGSLIYLDHKSRPGQEHSQDSAALAPPIEAGFAKEPIVVTHPKVRKASTDARLKYPQKCTGANGEVIFTDQPDCANAAPKSSFSIVESVVAAPRQSETQGRSKSNTRKAANDHKTKKPTLALGTAALPKDTPVECKFPMGKALEIERDLSAAKDPAESIWKKSYCRWIREARQDGCEVTSEHFYYLKICPTW